MYEKFADLLKQTGKTTYQVSKATGISTSAFTAWKQGKYNFKQDKLKLIADYFGVSTEYFYGDSTSLLLNQAELSLIGLFRQLNTNGKQKALDNLRDLTKISDYTLKGARSSTFTA